MTHIGKISLISLALTLPLFVSCDGGSVDTSTDVAENPTDRAQTLSDLEFGDTLTYLDSSGPALVDELVFGGANIDPETGAVQVAVTYLKTDDYTFDLSLSNADLTTRYNLAVSTLLGDLDSTFRQRLLDPSSATEPGFSRLELQSFVDDFSAQGAAVVLHPTLDKIFSVDSISINHSSTSTNAELLKGSMNGLFSADLKGRVIYFRRANNIDLATIRNLTASYWVPVLGQEPITATNLQSGRFELTLADDITVTPPQ